MFVVSAVASIGGALIGSSATRSAAKSQARSTDAALAEQRRQFDLQREDGAPYRQAGVNALQQFAGGIDAPTTAADVMADPGYQFALQQGQQGLDRRFAASGGRISGAAMKAASRFNVGTAASGFNAAYQRRQDRLNRLASLANIGQSATNASAQAGSAMANNISGLLTGQGNASAGAQMNQGRIWGNAGNEIAALYNRYNTPNSPYSSMAMPDAVGANGGFGWKGGTGGF